MLNAYLPIHLLQECLVRTSAESLARFKRVSKPWLALISSKEFACEHLKLSLTEPNAFAPKVIIRTLEQCEGELFNTFKLLTANLDSPTNFIETQQEVYNSHQEYGEIPFELIGSYHGLICMKYSYNGLCLYNPCIKKYRNIPYFETSSMIHHLNDDLVTYGFGYDDDHNDYKVIKLIPYLEAFEIYSLKSNCWERFHNFHITIPPSCSCSGVFVNSHLHWINFNTDNYHRNYLSIVGINLRTHGDYHVMELPLNMNYYTPKSLGVLNGCLAIFTSPTILSSNIEVWVMEEYGVRESWTLLTTIRLRQFVMNINLYGLRLCPNEEIVIQHSILDIVWYDIRRNCATKVKILGIERAAKEVYPIEYSLIDPNHI